MQSDTRAASASAASPVLQNVPQLALREASRVAGGHVVLAPMSYAGISMSWRITQVFRFRALLSELHGSGLHARCSVLRRYCRMINACL